MVTTGSRGSTPPAPTPVSTSAGSRAGNGKLNLHVDAGTSSFAGVVHVSVSGDAGQGVDEEDLPVGLTAIDQATVGHYHLVFTVPAGYSVTPASMDIDVLCDNLLDLTVNVQATTTTTSIAAPAITYGDAGAVTVSVASVDGAAPGSVTLSGRRRRIADAGTRRRLGRIQRAWLERG